MRRVPYLLLLVICLVPAVRAQDSTIIATVTHIAGDNAYINLGRDDGIGASDTLQIMSQGRLLGRMTVISTSSRQSVLGFVADAFPVTRGMRITVIRRGRPGQDTAPTEPLQQDPIAEATPSPTASAAPPPRREDTRRVRVDGRVMLGLNMLHSATRSLNADLPTVSRRFATPSLVLNATVRNLPSNARIQVHVRSEYRSSSTTIVPERSMRAYQLNVQKSLSFGEMQFGRFYNSLTPHGGYWDGATFMVGSRKAGVGGSLGFMPERANEGFTTSFPRFSLFTHYRSPSGRALRYRVAASYHQVHPTHIYMDHRFGEFSQEIDWQRLSLSQDLQLDQDPLSGGLVVSHVQLTARVRVTEGLQLRTRYVQRQPYRMYSTVAPISTRRDQVGGGFHFRSGDGSVGGEFSVRYTELAYDSRSILLYANSPTWQPLQLSLYGNASLWQSDFGEAIYASSGVMRGFGSGNVRVDYAYYRSTTPNQADPIDTHRISFSMAVPLFSSLYWNGRISLQQSQFLNSVAGQATLQFRF